MTKATKAPRELTGPKGGDWEIAKRSAPKEGVVSLTMTNGKKNVDVKLRVFPVEVAYFSGK
jgi:hypothetical protein